jgi:hypothetical protein
MHDQSVANQDVVSICTVKSPAEAEIIRGALESVGIACVIGGYSQAGLAGVLEIDVLTPIEDADRARKHLRLLRREKHERRKAQIEKRRAKLANQSSEAIMEMKPPAPPTTDIEKPAE